jgi:hypothetical protein
MQRQKPLPPTEASSNQQPATRNQCLSSRIEMR